MTTEIVHVEPNNSPSPEQLDKSLIDAQAKAKSLKNMISAHDWAVDIKGSEHIRVEAWITLATGYNCTAKVVPGSVKQIEGYRCAWEEEQKFSGITVMELPLLSVAPNQNAVRLEMVFGKKANHHMQ